MGMYGVKITGAETLTKLFQVVGATAFTMAVAQAAYAEATQIMLKSKAEVPLDLGTLRASGIVNEPVISGTTWEITMGYGGAASAYALIQHENLTFNHANGRSAKYLETPVQDAVPDFSKALVARVEQTFYQGGVKI